MSDNHSPSNLNDTQKMTPQGNLDELNGLSTIDDAHQTELELAQSETVAHAPAKEEDTEWEDLPLPGTLNLAADQSSASNPATQPPHTVTTERETELLTLIHDLNECNDVLLSRIAQLEGDLEKNQAILKTEIDKASFAQEKMAKQVSAEQSSAQQVSQNAQQQVGKLVSQLESNEQLLSRQQLINENLQTELANSQERITQLERECALASQQHADEAKARVKAETTSRDLRSRLQRQQRYTLQFKAALEKSLTVSTRSASSKASNTTTAQPVSFNSPATMPTTTVPTVTMPKAQQIMPWAAAATTPFQGIDPHLETLIRSAGKPTTAEPVKAKTKVSTPHAASPIPTATPTGTIDSDAEAKLWQDLERVINIATDTQTSSQPAAETTVADETTVKKEASNTAIVTTPESDTEPVLESAAETAESKFNWRSSTKANSTVSSTEPKATEEENKPSNEITSHNEIKTEITAKEAVQTTQRIITPIPPLAEQPAAQHPPFTEPSPWGKPLPEAVTATTEKTAVTSPSQTPDYLPAIDSADSSAISPVVNPLRTQKKKVSSLAAVELPTFETAKAGSFKR